MNELAPMVKNMEKLAADFSADPEQTLPEAAVMESAKSYREKKAKPLVKKIVQVMRYVYSAYLDISNKFTKLPAQGSIVQGSPASAGLSVSTHP